MPPGLVTLLKSLLAKKPGDRPAGCAQVAALCQARVAELHGGAQQARTGSVSSQPGGTAESSAFRKLTTFMEKNLGPASSEYQGQKVVHTTRSERLTVWILLLAFIIGFISLYIYLN